MRKFSANGYLAVLLVFGLLLTSCDKPSPKKETRPPWGKWLPPDAEHPEKRLEVKFGNVLYQIPVGYLSGDQNIEGSPWSVKIIATYPDLVPWQKAVELKIPHEPNIFIILDGHRDDPNRIIAPVSKKEELDSKQEQVIANEIKQCPMATTSLAKGMIQYTCNTKIGTLYFVPIDSNLRTPTGNKLAISCFDLKAAGVGERVKYECAILSNIFNDWRGAIYRIHLNELTDLLDVYHKTLQLLTSLEAPKQ